MALAAAAGWWGLFIYFCEQCPGHCEATEEGTDLSENHGIIKVGKDLKDHWVQPFTQYCQIHH